MPRSLEEAARSASVMSLDEAAQKAGVTPVGTQPAPAAQSATTQPQREPLLGSPVLGGVEKLGEGISAAGDFLYGSTAKVIGGAITSGIGSGMDLYGRATGNEEVQAMGEKLADRPETTEGMNPVDLGFAIMEMYPGGGLATKTLKKIPGGEKIVAWMAKLPAKLRTQAIEEYIRALGPTTTKLKKVAQEVAPDAVDRGLVFTSTDSLAQKAAGKVDEVGGKLSDFWESIPEGTRIKTAPALEALDKFAQKYIVEGKVIKPQAVEAIDTVRQTIAAFGDDISAKSARKMRQIFDEAKDFTKDEVKSFLEKAEREAANAFRGELAKDIPDLAKLNAEFHFWSSMKEVADATKTRVAGQSKGLIRALSGIAGGSIGASQGEGIGDKAQNTVLYAIAGTKAIDLIRSPAWRTISATKKAALANALAKGNFSAVPVLFGKMLSGVRNLVDLND